MNIKIADKDYTLNFTFNSFRFMQDFDLSELSQLENKPFRVIGVAEDLLLGALNNEPSKYVDRVEVTEFLANFVKEGNSLSDLLEELMDLLSNSDFFKSLQKKTEKKSKK